MLIKIIQIIIVVNLLYMVLIGVGRRVQQSARAAHQIKTDGVRPPVVGLMDWDGRLVDPRATVTEALADGVFLGVPTAEDVQAFVEKMASEQPVIMGAIRGRSWKRLLGR